MEPTKLDEQKYIEEDKNKTKKQKQKTNGVESFVFVLFASSSLLCLLCNVTCNWRAYRWKDCVAGASWYRTRQPRRPKRWQAPKCMGAQDTRNTFSLFLSHCPFFCFCLSRKQKLSNKLAITGFPFHLILAQPVREVSLLPPTNGPISSILLRVQIETFSLQKKKGMFNLPFRDRSQIYRPRGLSKSVFVF